MKPVGTLICFAGAVLWAYGYFVVGHPNTGLGFASFIPNLEAEIGMVMCVVGTILTYAR